MIAYQRTSRGRRASLELQSGSGNLLSASFRRVHRQIHETRPHSGHTPRENCSEQPLFDWAITTEHPTVGLLDYRPGSQLSPRQLMTYTPSNLWRRCPRRRQQSMRPRSNALPAPQEQTAEAELWKTAFEEAQATGLQWQHYAEKLQEQVTWLEAELNSCLLYTSPSPRDS